MNDEEYLFHTDSWEKKSIANSAFKRRTHTGKGGRVRFPSDHLTKKELEKMNGETKSYRLNEPVSWIEFKAWPDDIKVMYIKLLREKFNVPGRKISDMMNVDAGQFARKIRDLGIAETGRRKTDNWDKEGWYAWCGLVPQPTMAAREEEVNQAIEENPEEVPEVQEQANIEEIPDMRNRFMQIAEKELAKQRIPMNCAELPKAEPAEEHICKCQVERKKCVPMTGNMVFEGLAEEVLETIASLLGGAKVHISFTWDVVE